MEELRQIIKTAIAKTGTKINEEVSFRNVGKLIKKMKKDGVSESSINIFIGWILVGEKATKKAIPAFTEIKSIYRELLEKPKSKYIYRGLRLPTKMAKEVQKRSVKIRPAPVSSWSIYDWVARGYSNGIVTKLPIKSVEILIFLGTKLLSEFGLERLYQGEIITIDSGFPKNVIEPNYIIK